MMMRAFISFIILVLRPFVLSTLRLVDDHGLGWTADLLLA